VTDGNALLACTRCHRDVAELTESGLCQDCDEAAMIENVEMQSQRHRENPIAEP